MFLISPVIKESFEYKQCTAVLSTRKEHLDYSGYQSSLQSLAAVPSIHYICSA